MIEKEMDNNLEVKGRDRKLIAEAETSGTNCYCYMSDSLYDEGF